MLFSKNVKYHIMLLCFFSFPLRMMLSTELGVNKNSLFCKVCHNSKLFSSSTSLKPFGFYDEERVIVSMLFVVTASALNCSFSFSSLFCLFVCFFCLFQLTVSVALVLSFFNEPSSTNFFQRFFPFYFLFSVKFVVGLACAILDENLLSMSTGPMQSL